LTGAAAAWESSDDSSTIRIIFLKEESAWTAGISLKEELIQGSIRDRNFRRRKLTAEIEPEAEITRNGLQNQKGFTLIEILSVIVILGLQISTTIRAPAVWQ